MVTRDLLKVKYAALWQLFQILLDKLKDKLNLRRYLIFFKFFKQLLVLQARLKY